VRRDRAAGDHVVEALAQVRVVVEAEDRGRLGQALRELLAVPLRHAADRDDLRARLGRLQQRVDGVLLGRLDEAARVHDDHVRGAVVGQLPAAVREPAGELLGVDLVAGAAESEQGGTAGRWWYGHGSQGNCRLLS
jgi:hypothetical protein